MKNEVSVVVVTYNSSKNIRKLLDSLLNNKLYINEVTIIENDSVDKFKTAKICREYQSALRLKFIFSKNVGFGRSCNKGASLAKSNNILFLNPDTQLRANSLKTLVRHFCDNKADIIGGKAVNYEGRVHGSVVRHPDLFISLFEFSNLGKIFHIKSAHRKFYYDDKKIMDSKVDVNVDAVSGAYMLTSKEVLKKLNGFDENIFMYLEDVDLCKRANDMGLKVVFCPHSVIWHIGGASSSNKYKIRHQAWFDSRKYYFKKHFNIYSNVLVQPIYVIEEFILKKLRKL